MCGVLFIFDAGVAEPLKKVSLYIVAIRKCRTSSLEYGIFVVISCLDALMTLR
jgi:hypothetical protein